MSTDITQAVVALLSLIAVVLLITRMYIRYGYRKKPSMERRILDALIEYGCIEEPPFTPRTATAREVAHSIYSRAEYMKNPNHFDLLTARYLMDMEKYGDLGNSGETTKLPELAVKKGRWYIKWHPPSD